MQPENQGIRPWQWIVTIIVIIIIIIVGYVLFSHRTTSTNDNDMTTTASSSTMSSSNAEANSVVVTDQYPGNVVYISSVRLAQPGFVVIEKDNGGTPGAVIGSQYFPSGINPGKITLSSPTIDAGLYYASLYADTDGSQTFSASSDTLLKDSHGNSIITVFHALSNIPETKG